ncbi:MAG: M81 family metallopeptidase [Burkholderiales bacterium]|nr:M81 family metallopeptidase [Burkholderiales bacterium]
MARIAIGGFQHETNTFAPSPADYAAFESGGGWPGICFGADIAPTVAGANIPAAGACDALHAAGHQTVGLVWAAASPSDRVTADAFERIAGEMIARLRKALPVDGVYLDLHGAMVSESHDDGEGELLARVRAVVGESVPIAVSLDLHANVTRRMFALADAMFIYRTYPHVDMAETGARAAGLLIDMLARGRRPHKAFRTFDYLTGIPSQCSLIEPCKSLYALAEALDRRHGVALSFAPGFPMADFAECGMSIVGYGEDAAALERAMRELGDAIASSESAFALELFSPEDALRRAAATGAPGLPTVLADTQDNPGAGGNGDTTGLLAAMLAMKPAGATLGMLIDPQSAMRAHEVGRGNTAEFSLGAISGVPGIDPVRARFTVESLGDGRFTGTGPFYRNFHLRMGPMAALRSVDAPGVRVVLATTKCQTADCEMFRHVGIEPKRERIVAVKSSVHFRADFQPIAREVLVVKSPGPALADPAEFAWTRLRRGLRLRPLGPAF